MPALPQSDVQITIGQYTVKAFAFHVEIGTYGQLGRAVIHTTISQLMAQGFDLNSIESQTPNNIDIYIDLNGTRIFGGTYLHFIPTFEDDIAEFWARDFAGVLFDGKKSLSDLMPGGQLAGLMVSDYVRLLVNKFGQGVFQQIDIQITNDVPVGTIAQSDLAGNPTGVLTTTPQPVWNILVFLARMTGCQIYTDPMAGFHFIDQNRNPNSHAYTWLLSGTSNIIGLPQLSDTPVLRLQMLHQPARNKNFQVVVISHHAQTGTSTQASVVNIGQDLAVPGTGRTIAAGAYSGTQANPIRSQLSNSGLGMPVYEYWKDGLTPEAAAAQALGIANDIAQRLLVVTLVVRGDPTVKPGDEIQLAEGRPGALLGFAGQQLFVSTVSHHYTVPQGSGSGTEGFLTTIKALTIPPAGASQEDVEEATG